ncbi:MAG: CDP-alcohol phosphatidyltransferase family protein [Spirochaetales bacterium]|nr:CDP-alcohol phosphatidyltransferase family protein [Spirochaetales bacterium]
MKKQDPLSINIIITIFALFISQSLLFFIIRIFTSIPEWIFLLYYPVSCGFHGFILFALFKLKRYIVLEATGVPLKRLNIANIVTLVRMSAIPSIFFLLLAIHIPSIKWILIVYITFIFITDFLDGMIARALNQITIIGKYIDSSGDYMILFFSSLLYLYYSLIQPWFFIIILVRIFSIAIVAIILYCVKKDVVYTISFLGKASIFALMTLFALKLLPLFGIHNTIFDFILSVIEYITAGFLVVSFGERIFLLRKVLSEKKTE